MKKSNGITPEHGIADETLKQLAEVNQSLVKKHKDLQLHEELIAIKANRAELDNAFRPMLLNLGMVISILLAIIAINWRSYDAGGLVDLGMVQDESNEILDIPISKQPPPPPPPKQEVFKIAEVKDTEIIEDLNINLDVEVTAEEAVQEVEVVEFEVEQEVVEEIFVVVEEEPLPKGGFKAFYTFISENIEYPSTASRLGITGSVYAQFIVEKDGSITDIQIVKGIGAGCDEEAIRVLKLAPNWNPGKQRGMPVRVRKILPIKFMLKKY